MNIEKALIEQVMKSVDMSTLLKAIQTEVNQSAKVITQTLRKEMTSRVLEEMQEAIKNYDFASQIEYALEDVYADSAEVGEALTEEIVKVIRQKFK